MKQFRLEDMVRGWFVGDFKPTVHKTQEVEVAVKQYAAGSYEQSHFHKIATEITVILSGQVEMNGRKYGAGDIIVMEPGDTTDFRALVDTVNVVVKVPGAPNDKYIVDKVSRD